MLIGFDIRRADREFSPEIKNTSFTYPLILFIKRDYYPQHSIDRNTSIFSDLSAPYCCDSVHLMVGNKKIGANKVVDWYKQNTWPSFEATSYRAITLIFGIGTDIVKIQRFESSLERWGNDFAQRILNEREFIEFQVAAIPTSFLAKRFAAKEAVAKAFGTGFRNGLSLSDIEVDHEDSGKPILLFHGKAQELVVRCNIVASHISISDERDYVIAYVILEI